MTRPILQSTQRVTQKLARRFQNAGQRVWQVLVRTSRRSERLARYCYWRIVRLQDSPEYIARGIAVGVFAGCFPLFGVQTLVGVLLAVIARGHKLCAAVGTWVSNPLTYIPIYWMNFQVGRYLLGSSADGPSQWDSPEVFLAQTGEFLADLLVGCAVVGTFLASASYAGSLKLVRVWRSRRQRRRQRRSSQPTPHATRVMSYNR